MRHAFGKNVEGSGSAGFLAFLSSGGGVVIGGAVGGLFVFLLYLATLAPGVLPYAPPELHDVEMIQMQVCTLSITHPTGYPTYLTLAHLLTYLPFGDCAYRSNLASAVFGALAVALVYAAGYLVSGRVVGALVGAVAFGVGTTFWSQAVMAEVYTANALFAGAAVFAMLLWHRGRRDGHLVFGAFLIGLSMTNHMTSALLLPAGVLLVALTQWRSLLKVRLMAACGGAFLLGLIPYVYLPIRARTAPMIANNPDNFERFWHLVSGGDLRGSFFAFGPSEFPGRVAFYLSHLTDNFNWGLLTVAVVGLGGMLIWDRAAALFTGFLFAGWTFYAIENDISDIEVYFIPTYLIVSLWISGGVGLLMEEARALVRGLSRWARMAIPVALSLSLLVLPLAGVGKAYAANDMGGDYRARDIIENVAENTPRGATVLHLRSNLWYMALVEERRRDLTLVDPFQGWEGGHYSDVVWPGKFSMNEKRLRYGIGDPSGVTAARLAAEKGPVYLLAHENLDLRYFQAAGFGVERIEGMLYRLIPPQEPASTTNGEDGA